MKHWWFFRLLVSEQSHEILQPWKFYFIQPHDILDMYRYKGIHMRLNILLAFEHNFSPSRKEPIWTEQIQELLCCPEKIILNNVSRNQESVAHHLLEETSLTKWRLRRSKCKSIFFSNKSGASSSVRSMALRALPSKANWKIPIYKHSNHQHQLNCIQVNTGAQKSLPSSPWE